MNYITQYEVYKEKGETAYEGSSLEGSHGSYAG